MEVINMNMHANVPVGDYGNASLTDLVERWIEGEGLVNDRNWPDADMDRLVDVLANLRSEIIRRAVHDQSVLARYIMASEMYHCN